MVRHCAKRICIILLLVTILLCGCTKEKEISVKLEIDEWKMTDIEVDASLRNGKVIGVTEYGLFYETITECEEKIEEILSYHFLDFAGTDKEIYKKKKLAAVIAVFVLTART